MLYETDSVLRWTQIIGKIASILALLVDHLGWFARQGTIKNWSYDIESTMSCFFWVNIHYYGSMGRLPFIK